MYKEKKFALKPFETVLADIHEARRYNRRVERIFFADGDALCMSTNKFSRLLDAVREIFPECERVGAYSRSAHILNRSGEELELLRDKGLGIIYIGAESGSDEVLRRVQKGEEAGRITEAVRKAESAGIKTSVTFISGLGGRELLAEHAVKTGEMISSMGASYVGLLTLIVDPAAPIYSQMHSGEFEQLAPHEVMDELEMILENSNCEKETVFRSNHASNWVILKGTLPYDKERMIEQVRFAKTGTGALRKENQRRL
jgi:radical SAM superfamily enzyme YgiQ (UPF0313 family)